MRAAQLASFDGPAALRIVDLPEPGTEPPLVPGPGVVLEVKAVGLSFVDLLHTRGEYQMRPDLPFVLGSEVAGIVRSAPPGAPVAAGDRAAALCLLGGLAEVAVAPPHLTLPLPGGLDFAAGAGLFGNYQTAYFALVVRGRLRAGETVLVQGAAGGVGSATLQTAKGLGARTIAVVSSPEKEAAALGAGADHVVRASGEWRREVMAIADRGVDLVVDPVGGERFEESLRCLATGGRLVVVGFTSGSIPEIKVNRLLLRNVELIGAGLGEAIIGDPELARQIGAEIYRLAERGDVRPLVGSRFPLERAAEALASIDRREAIGKVVVEIDADAELS